MLPPRAHSLEAVLMGLHDASHAVYLLGIVEDDLSIGACKSKSSNAMLAPTLRGSHLLSTAQRRNNTRRYCVPDCSECDDGDPVEVHVHLDA